MKREGNGRERSGLSGLSGIIQDVAEKLVRRSCPLMPVPPREASHFRNLQTRFNEDRVLSCQLYKRTICRMSTSVSPSSESSEHTVVVQFVIVIVTVTVPATRAGARLTASSGSLCCAPSFLTEEVNVEVDADASTSSHFDHRLGCRAASTTPVSLVHLKKEGGTSRVVFVTTLCA